MALGRTQSERKVGVDSLWEPLFWLRPTTVGAGLANPEGNLPLLVPSQFTAVDCLLSVSTWAQGESTSLQLPFFVNTILSQNIEISAEFEVKKGAVRPTFLARTALGTPTQFFLSILTVLGSNRGNYRQICRFSKGVVPQTTFYLPLKCHSKVVNMKFFGVHGYQTIPWGGPGSWGLMGTPQFVCRGDLLLGGASDDTWG